MFVVSVVTVNAIPHSCGQRNQHFVVKTKTPAIPAINEISISLTGCGTLLLDLKKFSQIGSFVTPKGFQQGAKKQTHII